MTLPIFSTFHNPINVDIHSHLLPGIDDGVKTIEESISIIKKFQQMGYTKLITTPHIMSDAYPNTKEIILEKLETLQKEINKEGINIVLQASAEYYLDTHFLDLLKVNDILPFAGKYLLFETAYQTRPHMLDESIFEIQSKGYIPVFAHPERYKYLYHDMTEYLNLKEKGVLFQINIKSLKKSSSYYHMALKLVNLGLVDFIGSDVHRFNDLVNVEKLIQGKIYRRLFKKNKILNMELLA